MIGGAAPVFSAHLALVLLLRTAVPRVEVLPSLVVVVAVGHRAVSKGDLLSFV